MQVRGRDVLDPHRVVWKRADTVPCALGRCSVREKASSLENMQLQAQVQALQEQVRPRSCMPAPDVGTPRIRPRRPTSLRGFCPHGDVHGALHSVLVSPRVVVGPCRWRSSRARAGVNSSKRRSRTAGATPCASRTQLSAVQPTCWVWVLGVHVGSASWVYKLGLHVGFACSCGIPF